MGQVLFGLADICNSYRGVGSFMANSQNTISVSAAAALCGVARTTVGYWIRSKKLLASRLGRNYRIAIEDLLFFLQNSGQPIPPELLAQKHSGPFFRSFQYCWQFWRDNQHGTRCSGCVAFKKELPECFTVNNCGLTGTTECGECRYYQETYLPRIQFVHQINLPAAVFKDLHLWGGNVLCAELCGVSQSDLVGMGIEKIIDTESLPRVINGIRKLAQDRPEVKNACRIAVKNGAGKHSDLRIAVYPLRQPATAFLVLGVPLESH
jgi:excisionase family DNA binding protein